MAWQTPSWRCHRKQGSVVPARLTLTKHCCSRVLLGTGLRDQSRRVGELSRRADSLPEVAGHLVASPDGCVGAGAGVGPGASDPWRSRASRVLQLSSPGCSRSASARPLAARPLLEGVRALLLPGASSPRPPKTF